MTYALLAGAIAAIVAALLGGPYVIAFLRARGLGKAISADGPESHLSKAGTPTMGGLLIFGVALVVGAGRGGAEGPRRAAADRRRCGAVRRSASTTTWARWSTASSARRTTARA